MMEFEGNFSKTKQYSRGSNVKVLVLELPTTSLNADHDA